MTRSEALDRLGWDSGWSAAVSERAGCGIPGRVTRVDGGVCTVVTAAGVQRASLGADALAALAADPVDGPCPGDWAVLRQWPDGPTTLEATLPRRTAMRWAGRPGDTQVQVLAANVDAVGIVVAGAAPWHLDLLLALARESGISPVVIVTATDSGVSAGGGLDAVRDLLVGQATVALLGGLGADRSELTETLVGAAALPPRSRWVGGRDDAARGGAVRAELVPVPSGGCLIDIPALPDRARGPAGPWRGRGRG